MTKLSIITTLYNCDDFVEESLESIASQTYQDFEWIILDDGSSDMTIPVVENFIDKHPNLDITWKIDGDNIRIPRRRNQAINMARGEYVAIHDGDDVSLPYRFEKQMSFLDANKDVFCVGGHAVRIDHEGIENGIMSYPPSSHNAVVKTLLHDKKNPMIDPTTIFKREDFLRLGEYTLDTSIYTVPDMHLWGRAIVDGLIMRNIPEPLIKYRVNPDGMTRKHNSEMIRAHMQVWSDFRRSYSKSKRGRK